LVSIAENWATYNRQVLEEKSSRIDRQSIGTYADAFVEKEL
jgi:hypothetical protein